VPTHATNGTPATGGTPTPGVGTAAKNVAEHASALARLELELAALELKKKLAAFGLGIALLAGALVVGLFFFGWLLATITAALDTFVPRWLALLAVTLLLGAGVATLAFLGLRALKKGSPPVPRQAIEEAKLTTEALKSNGH
jgi:hypothetical protein